MPAHAPSPWREWKVSTTGSVWVRVWVRLVIGVFGPGVRGFGDGDFEGDAGGEHFLGAIVDVFGDHFGGGSVSRGKDFVEVAVVESAFGGVAFGPAEGTEVGDHDGVGAVFGGVELVGCGVDADVVGVAMEAAAGAIVVGDLVGGAKVEFGLE